MTDPTGIFDRHRSRLQAIAWGKTEAACRQLVSRAKQPLREDTPRAGGFAGGAPPPDAALCRSHELGDLQGLNALLDDGAELIGDGGGKVPSFDKLVGGKRVAQLFYAGTRRYGDDLRVEVALVNGEWALLRFIQGALESVQTYETDGQRIVRVLVLRNPDKLARVAAALVQR